RQAADLPVGEDGFAWWIDRIPEFDRPVPTGAGHAARHERHASDEIRVPANYVLLPPRGEIPGSQTPVEAGAGKGMTVTAEGHCGNPCAVPSQRRPRFEGARVPEPKLRLALPVAA